MFYSKDTLSAGLLMKKAACVAVTLALLAGCSQQGTDNTAPSLNGQSGSQAEYDPVEVTPPFWTVEDNETGATLYMLGSMHLGEQGVAYPDYIMEAYESCEKMAVELDAYAIDMDEMVNASNYLLLEEGKTLKDCMGEEAYDSAVEFLKGKNLYSAPLDGFIPYYLCSLVSVNLAAETGLSAEFGTETIFLARAHEDGKEIIQLESLTQQYKMMSEIPMSVQVETVRSCTTAEGYAAELEATKELYDAWKTFDETYLEGLNGDGGEEIPSELAADFGTYMNMMYDGRQVGMAEKAVEFLKSGEDVFMFVGAAHYYIGEDIIDLLEREGYTVNAVRPAEGEREQAA